MTKAFLPLLVAVLAVPIEGNACICPPGERAVQTQVKWADAVFLGEVQKIELIQRWIWYPIEERGRATGRKVVYPEQGIAAAQTLRVTFSVDREWKGLSSPTAVLITDGTSCDVRFTVGERYLVFAKTSGPSLYASACSLTGSLTDRRKELEQLGPPLKNWWAERAEQIKQQLAAEADAGDSTP